jgi:hypothetical protein
MERAMSVTTKQANAAGTEQLGFDDTHKGRDVLSGFDVESLVLHGVGGVEEGVVEGTMWKLWRAFVGRCSHRRFV